MSCHQGPDHAHDMECAYGPMPDAPIAARATTEGESPESRWNAEGSEIVSDVLRFNGNTDPIEEIGWAHVARKLDAVYQRGFAAGRSGKEDAAVGQFVEKLVGDCEEHAALRERIAEAERGLDAVIAQRDEEEQRARRAERERDRAVESHGRASGALFDALRDRDALRKALEEPCSCCRGERVGRAKADCQDGCRCDGRALSSPDAATRRTSEEGEEK